MGLKIGDKAPDFQLPSTDGQQFSLYKDQMGKPCILYFYPKDFTRGCTAQACSFRDHFDEFKGLNIDVYGISMDSVKSHLKFKEKHKLPFELLADTDGKVAKLFDAKVPFLSLTKRVSYLLDGDQKILFIYNSMMGFNKHFKKLIEEAKSGY